MLFETRKTDLLKLCPCCNGKIVRCIRKGTYESQSYGNTHGLQIWDRCEECKKVFGQTDVAIAFPNELEDQMMAAFDRWDQRTLEDWEFSEIIQVAFFGFGGWVFKIG